MFGSLTTGGEPRLVDDVRTPDEAHHSLGDRLRRRADGDPLAIGGAVDVARGVVGRAVAEALLQLAELVVRRDLGAEQHQDRLDDRHIDDLTAAGRFGAAQGGGDGEARRQGGDAVGEPERGQRRWAVRLTGDRGEPAHRLGDRPEPGLLGERTNLAEGGDPGDDQPRVGGVQLVWSDAPALQGSRAEVLDQHVGALGKAQQQGGPFGLRQVERHRPLVAPERLPPQPHSVARRPVSTGRIGLGRVLDLDDVGAEVAEEHRRHRPGEQCRSVDDSHARQRPRGTLICVPRPRRPMMAAPRLAPRRSHHVTFPPSSPILVEIPCEAEADRR